MSTAPDAYTQFLNQLFEAKLLTPSGVRGVYGRSAAFESIIDGFDAWVTKHAKADGADFMRFPPLVTRKNFEKSDYLRSFPQLMGSIHSFEGKDKDHLELLKTFEEGGDWSRNLAKTELMLCPAACYPVYPTLTGTVPKAGRLVDVFSFCFRHEPSDDPARMQMFRMHENIRVGSPDTVREFRDTWLERGLSIFRELGLTPVSDLANDPFFGRGGKMLAMNQRDQNLKFEILHPICSTEKPTALASFNYHQDHFGHIFDIHVEGGGHAHTACIGFGMERIALALLKLHGLDPRSWPSAVKSALGIG